MTAPGRMTGVEEFTANFPSNIKGSNPGIRVSADGRRTNDTDVCAEFTDNNGNTGQIGHQDGEWYAILNGAKSSLGFGYNVISYGARGNNTTDDSAAFASAIAAAAANGGGIVTIPPKQYKLSSPIALTQGVMLMGQGTTQRITGSSGRPILNFYGAGGFTVTASASGSLSGFGLRGLIADGTNATAGSSGLYLDATAASSQISGFHADDVTIRNFPQHQILHDGTVWDVCYRRVTAHNPDAAADDVVRIQNGTPSQITFHDCFLAPYTAGKWALKQTTAGGATRFFGGTVAPLNNGAGANGIYMNGGLHIYGAHLEGIPGQTGTIGIQLLGSLGSKLSPSACQSFGTNVQIGDGTATAARGWCIDGDVHGYNAGGGGDVVVTAGGSRLGMILNLGYGNATQTVVDNRLGTDALHEVGKLYRLDFNTANVTGAKGGNVALANLLTVLASLGLVVDSTT